MESPIGRAEYEEFKNRADDAHGRIYQRLDNLEDSNKQINDLAMSVRELALTLRNMAEEQCQQGEKLEELYDRDGDMWRKSTAYIVTAIAGAVIGYVMKQFGVL